MGVVKFVREGCAQVRPSVVYDSVFDLTLEHDEAPDVSRIDPAPSTTSVAALLVSFQRLQDFGIFGAVRSWRRLDGRWVLLWIRNWKVRGKLDCCRSSWNLAERLRWVCVHHSWGSVNYESH